MRPIPVSRLVVVACASVAFLAMCLLPAVAARLVPGAEAFSSGSSNMSVKTTAKKTKLKKLNTQVMPSVSTKAMTLLNHDDPLNLSLMVRASDGTTDSTIKKTVLNYWFWCLFPNGLQQQLLASGSTNFDKWGNASADADVLATTGNNYCERVLATFNFGKRGQLPQGGEIVANLNAQVTNDDCPADLDTLCLNGGRFQVDVEWNGAGNHLPGPGFAQNLGDDSGLFHFFHAQNWEMLVKVLDGCATNDHFWVFAAATTNVEFDLTVTDTMTGSSNTYSNPLGRPADAIIDTQAFATCP